jgi:hypothetical protein
LLSAVSDGLSFESSPPAISSVPPDDVPSLLPSSSLVGVGEVSPSESVSVGRGFAVTVGRGMRARLVVVSSSSSSSPPEPLPPEQVRPLRQQPPGTQ